MSWLKQTAFHPLKKAAYHLMEKLPAEKRVYFIYTHKNGFDRFYNGLKANTEISYWVYTALKERFPSIRFLRLTDEKPERIAQIRPQDVVIGHMGKTFAQAAEKTRKLIAFNPWAGHDDRLDEAFGRKKGEWWYEARLMERCASIILLTSEYNKATYIDQPTNIWYSYFKKLGESRRVRYVHQPIDLQFFKRIKWDYKTNDFLFAGTFKYMKRVHEARSLVQAIQRKITLFGNGENYLDNLNQSQVAQLPFLADFFIQPGLWEAQCVSILEAAARGFIPIVTPETGYPYAHPFLLRPKDRKYNLRILRELLATSPEERKKLADSLYQQLVTDIHHNQWKTLTDVLVEEVALLYNSSHVLL